MTGFVFHQAYFKHNPGWGHPERPERLNAVLSAYEEFPFKDKTVLHTPKPATEEQITSVHTPEYYHAISEVCRLNIYHRLMESELNSHSWEAALLAAGGGIEACRRVLSGEWNNAFCALRPPGHHAISNSAMGFCLFNNIAISAKFLLENGVNKILIADWDVHHGNGTQAAFYESDRVFFYSVHQRNLYPYGSGNEDQTGAGKGEGYTLNRPLPAGTPGDEHLSVFLEDLRSIISGFKPDIVLISSGFDSCEGDYVGSMNLEAEHYAEMTKKAGEAAEGKIVSFLEGGYSLDQLKKCFNAHL